MDGRELIRRLEASDPRELADIICGAMELLADRMRATDIGSQAGAQSKSTASVPLVNGIESPVTDTRRPLDEARSRGLLAPTVTRVREPSETEPAVASEAIEIGLVLGSIVQLDDPRPAGPPVDVLAVGHYLGVRPAAAELLLDQAISAALPAAGGSTDRLILTELTDRNILRGLLGQPFFIDDPRPGPRRGNGAGRRLVAVMGMGQPGTFGLPELIVLARELSWSVGRMGRDHLASVLIGAGTGNIPIAEAVEGWLLGIAEAVGEAGWDAVHRLRRVTFVENDPERIDEIDSVIRRLATRPEILRRARIDYTGLQIFQDSGHRKPIPTIDDKTAARLDALIRNRIEARYRASREAAGRGSSGSGESKAESPTRLNVEVIPIHGPIVGQPPTALPIPSRARYVYSAITDNASVPQREVVIDPRLIEEANNRLPVQSDPAEQADIGMALGHLLLPEDLTPHLNSRAPLVLTVDSNTARVHWEMIAQPLASASEPIDSTRHADRDRLFLGTYRTLTRQFRTTFAAVPAPSRPPRRELRVLVIADPAGGSDALVGAREEGMAVAELFERFDAGPARKLGLRVIVEKMIGPSKANRFDVIKCLLNEHYDVLHYAGHCYFNPDDPSASGWIFEDRMVLSANEMSRVKQVPRLVFSNACESGITPDRSGERSDRLAPSFAEAFFAQGVSDFICTAWPVDDATALRFARCLYSGLLGFDPDNPQAEQAPLSMHRAMQEARLEVIRPPGDRRTWGAYQHYGNPHFRFFDVGVDTSSRQAAAKEGASEKRPAHLARKTSVKKPAKGK